MFNLGLLMQQRGDIIQAEFWYWRAADAGHALAMLNFGLLIHEKGDLAEAEIWWRRALENGLHDALAEIGPESDGHIGTLVDNARRVIRMLEAGKPHGVCDICGSQVNWPKGHLLTTTQIVSTPSYWQRLHEKHRATSLDNSFGSYEEYCRHLRAIPGLLDNVAGQSTAWLVCEECVQMFDVDTQLTRSYAGQWWDSNKETMPPGAGPAPRSAIRMTGADW